MLRIFRHFFPVPTLLLGLSESVMLTFVLYVISQPLSVVSRGAGLGQAQFSVGFALLAIIAMMAVGLYNSDVFLDYRMASLRAALALGLVVPVAFSSEEHTSELQS